MPITGAYERATASRGAEEPTRLKTVLDRGRDSPSQGKGCVEQLLIFGMTKYRKGPTKDPQRTAKKHYGLSCRKLAPTELNGALYSSARQDFSHAAGLS